MNLAGIVLCGGESSRMQTDKSLINYHGIPQWKYIYQMLESFCSRVYISCNAGQLHKFKEVSCIVDNDKYANAGPLTGLLSAFEYLSSPLFVAGCDYPLLRVTDLQYIYDQRHQNAKATVAFHGLYEPVIGIYEYKAFEDLKDSFMMKMYSLQKCLEEIHAGKAYLEPLVLRSANTLEEMKEALSCLKMMQD